MARLRNLSTSLLRPFQSPTPDHQHSRSTSQPLALQTSNSPTGTGQEKPLPSPTTRDTGVGIAGQQRTPTRQGDYSTGSRPTSMLYGTPADIMARGEIEELRPVFSFLSSHGNKLYQEGYFLKLNDLDTSGKPFADRSWTECFAQLVGTVLSLWDAAALDAAGEEGEVAPNFINLVDASIKMIETLPTRNPDVQPLQNVLSVSTAGKNRYLLHFNSLHSLTQWTASIRLAMFEHASLQELYTGSLIAGKGKNLNNIKAIMERTRFSTEDWARVRFGAGTPWRRCWCVIEPPNEKELAKAQKSLKKTRNSYERPKRPKGCIKFYDTKKIKKALPIATISDAYAAYAIYPQSKPLIDQSTLVKVEGKITIHSVPESRTEGFVFVMPEVHPAVSGFEMMLRWLFPVFDSFGLYGRPERLIADRGATNGLMFAMPQERRYGYLDIIDVAALIHTTGSDKWSEKEWRKRMKEATRGRMGMVGGGRTDSNLGSRRGPSESFGFRNSVRHDDNASIRSHPSTRHQHNQSTDAVFAAPQQSNTTSSGQYPLPAHNYHARSVSESVAFPSPSKSTRQDQGYMPSRLSMERSGSDPAEPTMVSGKRDYRRNDRQAELDAMDSKNSSDSELGRVRTNPEDINQDVAQSTSPAPVMAPPTFTHQPGDRPQTRPTDRPELRREKSRMSNATLTQMIEANKNSAAGSAAAGAAAAAWKAKDGGRSEHPRGVNETPEERGVSANRGPNEGMVAEYSASSLSKSVSKERSPSSHSVARKPLPRSPSSHSVTRRPLPSQDQPPPVPQVNESTLGLSTDVSLLSVPPMQRQASGSQYSVSDQEDELEENPFSDTHRMEKPRTGMLKTAGDPGYEDGPKSNIPDIDFGVTKSLNPNVSRPGTSGNSPVGRKSANSRARTPERELDNRSQSRSPVAWQPGSGRQSPGPSLTPEEFVHQHAAAARVPYGYVPYRNQSAGERQPQPPRPVQNAPAPRPAHQAAQLAYNYSQQQQGQRAPMQGQEPWSYNHPPPQHGFHGQPPQYQQQQLPYNYQQQQQDRQQAWIDARQHGQWVSQGAQAQQNEDQQWQQDYSGYYGSQQGRR